MLYKQLLAFWRWKYLENGWWSRFIKKTLKVFERTDYLDFKYIGIFENTAYAVYRLKADFADTGNSTEKNWTESVIFKKIKGKWKIERIHSPPVKLKWAN